MELAIEFINIFELSLIFRSQILPMTIFTVRLSVSKQSQSFPESEYTEYLHFSSYHASVVGVSTLVNITDIYITVGYIDSIITPRQIFFLSF